MKHLLSLNTFFWKYKRRLVFGVFFIIISNYFGVLAPQVTGFVIDEVKHQINPSNQETKNLNPHAKHNDYLVDFFIEKIRQWKPDFSSIIMLCGLTLLALALLRGLFMFFMRQTIIVMSRHIEYDQKNQVYKHYQKLDMNFFKTHHTGDLMNRIAEDVSRVRMYTGPALMYLINLIAMIILCTFYMWHKSPVLTLWSLAPLPLLAIIIYFVNNIINKKSEKIQSLLSDLTTNAQESFSGIRIIKSYRQEQAMIKYFDNNSAAYRTNALSLAKTEAIYFPVIAFIIGLSIIITVYKGGLMHMQNQIAYGDIAAFVMYILMMTFPVSAIGWVASTIQRAAASQKRLNEFLFTKPAVNNNKNEIIGPAFDEIVFKDVQFTYPHTGIVAIKDFNLHIHKGEKIAIVGKTGSGKSTIAQLLLRFYDIEKGLLLIDGIPVQQHNLQLLRKNISYVPQDVFLFSDTVSNNISFGDDDVEDKKIEDAAKMSVVEKDIQGFENKFETMIGERGVTLSGGQKQRISIARALIKNPELVIFDDCLSAVDAKTEKEIIENLNEYLKDKTSIIITHRIFSLMNFDKIIVLQDGRIAETGTHEDLLIKNGYYAQLYKKQQEQQITME